MKIQAEVDALERLAALDESLVEFKSELGSEREGLEEKKARVAELKVRLERHRETIADMERQRGENVQEVRQMNMQVDRSREKLSRCRTEREANAVQRELEELRKLQRDREIEIQKLDELHDKAQADIDAAEAERSELETQIGDTEAAASDRMKDLEKQIADCKAERETVVKRIKPVTLYRRYELIRKRYGSAVAHTTDGKCSACHMLLLPMMFQTLRRGETFDQCSNCQRIIYFKRPDSSDSE